MLHRDMIEHVRKAFKAVFSQRKVISASDLKGEWLVSIYYEQPRWMGPEIAAALEKNIGKFYSVQEACERMARLYAEVFKYIHGRGPYLPSVLKDLTRTLHAAVVALVESQSGGKASWKGATVACNLVHAFRKILYGTNAPTHATDSIWRLLSTCTLPARNQSSKNSTHESTWYDMLVRYAIVETAKLDKPNWDAAYRARDEHPEINNTILAQVQAAERATLCSEAGSDKMRVAFDMGARPDGQMGADFQCLEGLSIEELLLETGADASDIGSVCDDVSVTPEKIKPVANPGKRGRGRPPKVLDTATMFAAPWVEEESESEPELNLETEPKTRRLVSALDARKDWRRTDGTLYSYFRVKGGSLTRVANNLREPTLRIIEQEDLLCADEAPLTWVDGALPCEASRIFMPV